MDRRTFLKIPILSALFETTIPSLLRAATKSASSYPYVVVAKGNAAAATRARR